MYLMLVLLVCVVDACFAGLCALCWFYLYVCLMLLVLVCAFDIGFDGLCV